MKVGIYYNLTSDTAIIPFLYCVTNGNIEFLDGFITRFSLPTPTKFKIDDDGIQYYFTPHLDEISDYDIKIFCLTFRGPGQLEEINKVKDSVDYILLSKADGESVGGTFEVFIKEYLKVPNLIFISGQHIQEIVDHPRVITDLAISLYFFYNGFGYYYLNYYPTEQKQHLIGIYNKFVEYKPTRQEMIDFLKEEIGQDIHRFETGTEFETEISGRLLARWAWQGMHMPSYLDYNTCTANIIFETRVGYDSHETITEKTLKSIIFQKAKIFFIYFGTSDALEWLHDRGFWFLNSEFYDKDNLEFDVQLSQSFLIDDAKKSLPLYRSVYKSIEYLKNLKDELKTDTAVYNFLLDKYGNKLNQNSDRFQHLIKNCEYKEKLLNLMNIKKV